MEWQLTPPWPEQPRTVPSPNASIPGQLDCTPETVVFWPQTAGSEAADVTILKSAPWRGLWHDQNFSWGPWNEAEPDKEVDTYHICKDVSSSVIKEVTKAPPDVVTTWGDPAERHKDQINIRKDKHRNQMHHYFLFLWGHILDFSRPTSHRLHHYLTRRFWQ